MWEFYAHWKTDARSHYVTVQGMEVPLTPATLNKLLGIADAPFDFLTGIIISPPYQEIRNNLCGTQSMAKWIRHGHCGFHQFLPYAHMNRDTQVWLKIIMNWLILWVDFTRRNGTGFSWCMH